MDVSVIIINYNTFELTCSCIRSIYEFTKDISFEIILVDNNSSECPADLFKQKFPDIRLIKSLMNIGFAKGNNLGLEHADGNYILLLNSDIQLMNNAITLAYREIKNNKKIGALSGKLIYPDGTAQPVAGKFPSLSQELRELFRINRFLSEKSKSKYYLGDRHNYEQKTECDWIWGAFFMIPKVILTKFKGFKLPDDFFMYAEDMQWCYKIKKYGYAVFFTPEPLCIHYHGGSEKTKTDEWTRYKTKMLPNTVKLLMMEKGIWYTRIYYLVKSLLHFSLITKEDFMKAKVFLNIVLHRMPDLK
jgi:GT2 family glycosyltransferase